MEDKKAELFRCGKELFIQKGFKDTNVADITRLAGVAVGTFYNYYPSKEKLFMEIYMEENTRMSKALLEEMDLGGEPVTLIRQMLAMNMERMRANPILSQWYSQDAFAKLEKLYRDEAGMESIDFLYQTFFLLVKKWQQEGRMRSDIDPEMIMAIFGSIIRIGMHKEEIGLKYFPMLQDYLTEFTLQGLTEGRKTEKDAHSPA